MIDFDLVGKGFFTWPLMYIQHGDPTGIAELVASAGLSHVLIQVTNGTNKYNQSVDVRKIVETVRRLNPGIKVLAWCSPYGYYPATEAQLIVDQLRVTPYDALVWDIEAAWKREGASTQIQPLVSPVRAAFPDLPFGLSSYRYPSYHPGFPWNGWSVRVDFMMPQVYWEGSHDPGYQLERTVVEYRSRWPNHPIFPTGAAYGYGPNNWQSTPRDVLEFIEKAKVLGLAAVNFWEVWRCLYHTYAVPAVWDAIAAYDWPYQGPLPEPPPPPLPEEDIMLPRNFKALVQGQYVRTGPTTSSAPVRNLTAGQVLTGCDDLRVNSASEVWLHFNGLGWIALVYGGRQYLDEIL